MIIKLVAALGFTALSVVAAPVASADTTCQFPVAVIAVFAPVTLICGDANNPTTNHVTTVTVDPSLQVDPHLFQKAPQ